MTALTLAMSPVACKPKRTSKARATISSSAVTDTTAAQVTTPKRSGLPTLEPLSASQAQAVLPKEMAAVTLGLPAMYRQVNTLAAAQGLEGWPDAEWPFADDSEPERRVDPLKELHPAIRLIWGNVNVLWIHSSERQRWDALILMHLTKTTEQASWRLMWLKDAFGHASLTPALPNAWQEGNTLDWSDQANLTYAKNLNDIQKAWAYSSHPGTMAFTCNQPDTDTGLSLQYDPDLGVGGQISGVAEEDPSEDMNWYLSPKEFDEAKILRMGNDFVWVDIGGIKGVAPRADWDQWTLKFKGPATKP